MICELFVNGVAQGVTLIVHQCVHPLDMDENAFYLCTVSQ